MNRFTRLITNNFQYKLTALLMALVIWYIIQGEENLSINRRVYFNLRLPKGYLVKGSTSRSKEVTLSGPRNLISELSLEPLQADLSIPKGTIGDMRIDIDPSIVKNINPKIKITMNEPFLMVFIDKRLSRTLPIKESLQGQLKDGYLIDKIEIEPRSVQLSGLSSEISALKEVLTEPIDIADLDKSQIYEMPLLVDDLQSTKLSIDHVLVKVLVSEQKSLRRFTDIPLVIEGADKVHPDQVKILEPEFVSIGVSAGISRLSTLKRSDFKAYITLTDQDNLPTEKKIQIQLPENTSLIETAPMNCRVSVKPQAPMTLETPAEAKKKRLQPSR